MGLVGVVVVVFAVIRVNEGYMMGWLELDESEVKKDERVVHEVGMMISAACLGLWYTCLLSLEKLLAIRPEWEFESFLFSMRDS